MNNEKITDPMGDSDSVQKYGRPILPGRAIAGIVLIAIGGVFLARELGMPVPEWLFSWPVFLIVIGLYSGAKHSFRNPGWIILTGLGGLFLADHFFEDFNLHNYWPVLIIVAGLFMLIRPRRGCKNDDWKDWKNKYSHFTGGENTATDTIDVTCIFSGVKRNIISKTFKGGVITCVFGGAELNLMQADIEGTAVLDVTQIFGGVKLLLPANWEVHSEIVTVLGGVEDKRPLMASGSTSGNKVLILKGSCIFGGVDIKSY